MQKRVEKTEGPFGEDTITPISHKFVTSFQWWTKDLI